MADMPQPDPPPAGPAPAPPGGRRICTVTDGVEAVMRLAEFLAHLPGEAERTDLQLADAAAALAAGGAGFDTVLFAPRTGRETALHMTQAALDAAAACSREQFVLLPHGARAGLVLPASARIVHGPPFRAPDLPPGFTPEGPAAEAPADPAGRGGGWLGRLFARPPRPGGTAPEPPAPAPGAACRVLAFQGMAGGAGATTLALNLAAEMARLKPAHGICLIDLNIQFGNLATYLNIPTSSKIADAYRNLRALDTEAFGECLFEVRDNLHVFGAPAEILPYDALTGDEIETILSLALGVAGTVILDLPHAITDWSEKVYVESDRVFCISTQEIRAAQNARKLGALLRGNSLPPDKFVHCLNRAPARRTGQWRANRESFEKGIGAAFAHVFSDGGPDVAYCSDFGAPIAEIHPNNPLRRDLMTLAGSLVRSGRAQDAPAMAQARG